MSIEDRATSVVSMDDPDVRIAAEALSGLGNPGEHTLQHSFYSGELLLRTNRPYAKCTGTEYPRVEWNAGARQQRGTGAITRINCASASMGWGYD